MTVDEFTTAIFSIEESIKTDYFVTTVATVKVPNIPNLPPIHERWSLILKCLRVPMHLMTKIIKIDLIFCITIF